MQEQIRVNKLGPYDISLKKLACPFFSLCVKKKVRLVSILGQACFDAFAPMPGLLYVCFNAPALICML